MHLALLRCNPLHAPGIYSMRVYWSGYVAAMSLLRSIYLPHVVEQLPDPTKDTHTAHDLNPHNSTVSQLQYQYSRSTGLSHEANWHLFLSRRLPPVFESAKRGPVFDSSKPSQFRITYCSRPTVSLRTSSCVRNLRAMLVQLNPQFKTPHNQGLL